NRRFCFFLLLQFVNGLNEKEYRERDQYEVEHSSGKRTNLDTGTNFHLAPVPSRHQRIKNRHNQIVNDRRNDFSEGGTDYHTNSEVNDVTSHCELFELF